MKWDEAVRATDVVWTRTVFAVGCRLCRLHTSENFHLHRTEESEREESREQRTTENQRILFVFLVVFTAHRRKHVKYASISLYCGTCSDKWNRRQIVFQCFKMSEDELMPNLRVSYFCLDETVAAVSTQHRASYQRNSRLPLIVEFWLFIFFIRFYFYVNFRLWIICFHDTSYTRRTNNREKHFNGVFMKTMDLLFPLTTKLKIYHKECFYTGSLNLQ